MIPGFSRSRIRFVRSALLFSLFLGTPGRLLAEDLDVPRARTAYNQARAEADRAKTLYDREVQIDNGLKEDVADARSREESARRELDNAKDRLSDIERQISNTETEISELRFDRDRFTRLRADAARDIPDLRRKRDNLKTEAADLERAIREIQREIDRLQNLPGDGPWTVCFADRGHEEHSGGHCATDRDKTAASEAAKADCLAVHGECRQWSAEQPDPPELAQLIRQRDDLKRDLANTERDLNSAENELTSKENEVRDLDNKITQTERQIVTKQSTLASLRDDRIDLRSRITTLEGTYRSRQNDTRDAELALQRHQGVLDNARFDWQRQESEAQTAFNYLQQVIANYNAALNRVLAQADAAASQHSDREAGERAPQAGSTHGKSDARTIGEERGTLDGQARESARGYRDGRQNASTAPSLENSYRTGKVEGERQADAKAFAESFPKGYNDLLDQRLSQAPDNSAVVDITERISDEPGENGQDIDPRKKAIGNVLPPNFGLPNDPVYNVPVAGQPVFNSPAADFRYRNYPCTGLPLPEFEPRCRERYDATYASAFTSGYRGIYTRSYQSSFNGDVQSHYDAALGRTYDASLQAGRQSGAKDQGILDGFATSLAGAVTRQYAAGQQAARNLLDSGHLIIVRQVTLTEESGDKLFSSGDRAKLQLVLDNYGKMASPRTKVRVRITGKTNAEALTFEIRDLPALAGNTRTTLQGVVAAKISAAPTGAKVSLDGVVEFRRADGTYAELEKIAPSAVIKFPLEIQALTLAKKPRVDEEVAAKLKVVNNTEAELPESKLALSSAPNIVAFPNTPATIPALAPGASVEVDVKVKPGVWVGDGVPVNVLGTVKDVGGLAEVVQLFPQIINIDRNASLLLQDRLGNPAPTGIIDAVAGSIVQFKVKFNFLSTVRQPGPFVVRYTQSSDPAMRPANNSTISVNYGSWSPGTTTTPINFAFNVPQTLSGKEGWILIQLDDGARAIHVLQVRVRVR
jgi:predicted  nucleic acid-binding Zn-ribbon protein